MVEICSGSPWVDGTDQGGLPGQHKRGDLAQVCGPTHHLDQGRARRQGVTGRAGRRPALPGPPSQTKRIPCDEPPCSEITTARSRSHTLAPTGIQGSHEALSGSRRVACPFRDCPAAGMADPTATVGAQMGMRVRGEGKEVVCMCGDGWLDNVVMESVLTCAVVTSLFLSCETVREAKG